MVKGFNVSKQQIEDIVDNINLRINIIDDGNNECDHSYLNGILTTLRLMGMLVEYGSDGCIKFISDIKTGNLIYSR